MTRKREGLPSKGRIFKHWEKYLEERWFNLITFETIDLTIPFCWACKREIYVNKKSKDIYARWNNAKGLERHHIDPHAKGGTDDADNLFLLCKNCHSLAPTYCTRKQFLRWAVCQHHARQREMEFRMTVESMLFPNDAILFLEWHQKFMQENIDEWKLMYKEFIEKSVPHYDGNRNTYPISSFAIKLMEKWKVEVNFYD